MNNYPITTKLTKTLYIITQRLQVKRH